MSKNEDEVRSVLNHGIHDHVHAVGYINYGKKKLEKLLASSIEMNDDIRNEIKEYLDTIDDGIRKSKEAIDYIYDSLYVKKVYEKG